MSNELQTCIRCKKTRTVLRNQNGDPECASCGNDIYFGRVSKGEIVELKIDMTVVKQETLAEIQSLIQRDMEAHKNHA